MSQRDNKKRNRYIKMMIAVLAIIVLIIFLTTETGGIVWGIIQMNGNELRSYIRSKGNLGPFIFFLFSYFQVVIAPIPGQVAYFVGGMLFGAWGGFLINHTATILGSLTAYALGRVFGEPISDRLAGKGKAKKFTSFVNKNGPIFFLLAFVIPGLPDDLLCYVAGIVGIPFGTFFFLASVARIPTTLFAAILGAGALVWTAWELIAVIGMLAVFITLVIIFRKPITKFLNNMARGKNKDYEIDIEDMMD